MTEERRLELGRKIIAIARSYRKGYEEMAFRSTLLILAEVIGELRDDEEAL